MDIKPRNIEIYNIELIKIEGYNITFRCSCSKGTYIRTLCEDIAQSLGTVGFMSDLNREKVGEFDLANAITVSDLEQNFSNQNFLDKYFIGIEKLFEKCEKIDIKDDELKHFINGVKLTEMRTDGIYRIYNNRRFVGLGVIKGELLKRDIVI